MDDTPSSSAGPVEPAVATDAAAIAAHAAAIAHAADQAAQASLALLRGVLHAALWLIGGLAMVVAADSMPWGLSEQQWVKGAVILPMLVIGFELGRRAQPRTRHRAAAIVGLIIGFLAGYAMDRMGGAMLTAPIAALCVFIINLIIDAVVPRLSPIWRLRMVWGTWACIISSALLAVVIRLAIGKLDDDDFSFFVLAGAVAIMLANHHDWFIDSNLTLANMLRKLQGVARLLLHRRVMPFVAALLLASSVSGSLAHRPSISEADIVTIASSASDYVWPACFVGAAVMAWALSRGQPAPIFRKAMVLLALLCIHWLLQVAVFSARFDFETVTARPSLWKSYSLERGKVKRITYERRTGRRSVAYHAIIHQQDGSYVNIGGDKISWRAVDWMRDQWGVEEQKWR